MSNKQIYAALEIADHEIRLIVSEYHNLKFNVLKVERVEIEGVIKQRIINDKTVVSGIKKAVANASKTIGAPITKVILVVPSLGMQRFSKRVTVSLNKPKITIEDIQNAIKVALTTPLDPTLELVNFACLKYIVNGFTTRRIPVNEKAESLAVELDLLCALKEMVWEYAKCIEQAGLEITDLFMDSYALSTEAALFERAIGHYVLLIRLEQDTTTLALLANGKIESSLVIDKGYGQFVEAISDKYNLPVGIADRLVRYNCRLKGKVPDTPIYLWSEDNKPHTISEQQVAELVRPLVLNWIDDLKTICQDILEHDDIIGVLSGEGAEILNLVDVLSDEFKVGFSTYLPETLGVRNSALTACMGALYCYNDQEFFRSKTFYSIDESAFMSVMDKVKISEKAEKEDTLTNRFKKIFK
ncbi:MAG: hypothetical protein VB012_00885 [Erysipelotrichaceae bacterium]|nr:hypothetical protein [Erysipelotrichaceae bacterium]